MSGDNTKITPEQKADKNITIAAGKTLRSSMSLEGTFSNLNLNFTGFSSDSFTKKMSIDEKIERALAIMNKLLIPTKSQIVEPNPCPTPIPSEVKVPQIPIPIPLLLVGNMSVIRAVDPVGIKPALKP